MASANELSTTDNSDSHPMDFIAALDENRSLLYVQGRLFLTRLREVLASNSQIHGQLSSSSPTASETQLVEQFTQLVQTCGLGCWRDGHQGSLSLRAVRLLTRLCALSGWATDSLMLSLKAAVDSAPGDKGEAIWRDCMKFAGSTAKCDLTGAPEPASNDDVYGIIKGEIQGTQCLFPMESKKIQQALIILNSISQ